MRRLHLNNALYKTIEGEIKFDIDKSISIDIIKEIDIVLTFGIYDLIYNKMGHRFKL